MSTENDLHDQLAFIRAAARSGAASITGVRQTQEDAADQAVFAWECVSSRGGSALVGNATAWAFRVGANAAKALARQRARWKAADTSLGTEKTSEQDACCIDVKGVAAQQAMEQALRRSAPRTSERHRAILSTMSQPGMTYHEAARVLGIDRSNLRRTFHGILKKLRAGSGFHDPLPPLG